MSESRTRRENDLPAPSIGPRAAEDVADELSLGDQSAIAALAVREAHASPPPDGADSGRTSKATPLRAAVPPASLVALQRLAGNAAVSALLDRRPRNTPVQRRTSTAATPGKPDTKAPDDEKKGGETATDEAKSPEAETTLVGGVPVKPGIQIDGKGPEPGPEEKTAAVGSAPGTEVKATDLRNVPVKPPEPQRPPAKGEVKQLPAPPGLGPGAKPPAVKEAKEAKGPEAPKAAKAAGGKGLAALAEAPGPPVEAGAGPLETAPIKPPAPAAPPPVPDVISPTTASPGAAIIVQEVKGEAEKGRTDFLATVDQGLGEIDAATQAELARIDTTAGEQKGQIDGAFKAAKAKVAGAVAAAGQKLEAAATDSKARLDTGHTDAKTAAKTSFDAKKKKMQDLGETRGQEAKDAAETAATQVETDVETKATQAEKTGEGVAKKASSDLPEAVDGMRQAAREVGSNTAGEIRKSLGDTSQQLRQGGADAKPSYVKQANEMAGQLLANLPGILEQISKTHGETSTNVSQAAATGKTSISELGKAVMANLDAMHKSLSASLAKGVAQNKAKVAESGEEAKTNFRSQRDAAIEASTLVVNQVLAGVANRQVRREAAQRLAKQMGADVRSAFAGSQGTAQQTTAQVAATFAVASEQTLAALRQIGTQAQQEASKIGSGSAADAVAQGTGLADSVTKTADTGIKANTSLVKETESSLDTVIADVDTKTFAPGVAEHKTKIAESKSEAAKRADEPGSTVETRALEASQKADESAHKSWLERQLDDISEAFSWSMLAGLIVGLLVTIAIIALFGSGFWVLVIAGAVAGALSTLASTLVEKGLDVDPWELGRDMLIGAAFGAIGGAIGGGMTAGLQRGVASTLLSKGTAAVLGQVGDVASGVVLGAVQNVATGQPWDKGLLLNLGMGVAMSGASPLVEKFTHSARAAAIDKNVAIETKISPVTPEERTAANMRAHDKGLDPPYPTAKGPRAETPTAGAGATPTAATPAGAPPVDLVPGPPAAKAKAPAEKPPVPGMQATPKQVETNYGIPPKNQEGIGAICKEHGVEAEIRPTNPDSAKFLAEGTGVAKHADVKSKTITPEDVALGCRPEDKGKVGFFKPKEDLPTLTKRLEAEGYTPEQIEKIKARHKERTDEYNAFKESMEDLQKPTNKQESDRFDTSGQLRIDIDENGVVYQVDKDGNRQLPFVGDHDVWDIRRPGGPPLSVSEYRAIIDKMKAAGIGVAHGSHLNWAIDAADFLVGKVKSKIYKPIFTKHTSGNEPVVRFGPNGEMVPVYVGPPEIGTPGSRGGTIGGVVTEGSQERQNEEAKEGEYATQP